MFCNSCVKLYEDNKKFFAYFFTIQRRKMFLQEIYLKLVRLLVKIFQLCKSSPPELHSATAYKSFARFMYITFTVNQTPSSKKHKLSFEEW